MHLTALGGGREPVFVDLLKDGQTILTEALNTNPEGSASRAIDLPPDLAPAEGDPAVAAFVERVRAAAAVPAAA